MNPLDLSEQPSPELGLPEIPASPQAALPAGVDPWAGGPEPLLAPRSWWPAPGLADFARGDVAELAACLAALAIPLVFVGLLARRRESPLRRSVAGFGALALVVGFGHAAEVARPWCPAVPPGVPLKALTAAFSWAAVVAAVHLAALIRGAEDRLADLQGRLDAARDRVRHLEREGDQIKRANLRLADLSETDELTGLKNRRHFLGSFQANFAIARHEGRSLSILMLDVDNFKSYNDQLGHPAGDDVLRATAAILREHVRPYDLVARFGGEEFMVLLPDTDAPTGCAVAERLRAAIAEHPWPSRRVTASFGVATTQPRTADPAELIEAADAALYQSKAAGRNRVTHGPRVAPRPGPNAAPAPGPAPAVPAASPNPTEGPPPFWNWVV